MSDRDKRMQPFVRSTGGIVRFKGNRATAAARAQGFDDAKGCRDDGCPVHCGVKRENGT